MAKGCCQLLHSLHCKCMQCGGYLRQGQTQGESSHQQQMRLDPRHRSVRTAHWVNGLVCFQEVLGLHPKTAHGVNHSLCDEQGQRWRERERESLKRLPLIGTYT